MKAYEVLKVIEENTTSSTFKFSAFKGKQPREASLNEIFECLKKNFGSDEFRIIPIAPVEVWKTSNGKSMELPKIFNVGQLLQTTRLLAWREMHDKGGALEYEIHLHRGKYVETEEEQPSLGSVLFSKEGAKELCRQLNEGEFIL